MSEEKTILTQEGLKTLKEELKYLKVVKRKEMAIKIKEARSQGDLSENAEYDAAMEEQAEMEARIKTLDNMIQNAKVINTIRTGVVGIGNSVKLYDEEFDEEVEYILVGAAESDPFSGKISNESPLGKAILGHKADEIVEVDAPDGIMKFKILEVN
ncbi:MAG: transcription elongation factor GreA [bacterium]